MNHPIPSLSRRNRRALFASLLSYLLLAGQLTPLVLASNNSAARTAPSRAADVARVRTGGAPATEAAPAPVRLSPVPVAIAPNITATKVDAYTNSPNPAEPGDTINYTVTISNTGPGATDATNVVFTDTIDPNTTFSGTATATPIAANDAYNVLGNVRIQVPAGSGLLVNDNNPQLGGNAGLTPTLNPGSVTAGAEVTVGPDGSFSYNPPAGFEGTDTFTYTVTSAQGTDTGTVTLTVTDVVFFVNSAAGACASNCNGRLTNPLPNLSTIAANSGADPDETFDVIFVHTGTGNYTGGIALENNQRLVGQGVSLDSALAAYGITVPPHSDARPGAGGAPTIVNTSGNAITLASDNDIRALNVSAANNAAIFGSGVGGTTNILGVPVSASSTGSGVSLTNQAGTLTMTGGSIAASSSGTAVLISGGTANITFSNVPVSQTGGRVVDIQTKTGGSVVFNSGSTVSGTAGTTDAVVLRNHTGGTIITFSNNVTVATTGAGARALVADNSTGNFTLNMTASGNTLSAGNAGVVDVEDVAANMTFTSTTSANSSTTGIRVNNTTGSISFGATSATSTGGTAVLLTSNASTISFGSLNATSDPGQRGFHATSNTGNISSTSGTITTTTGTAVEITGTTPLNMTLTQVNVSGAPSGIVISGNSGNFSVIGDNSNARNGSGGVMSNTTDDAIRLTNATNVTLKSINLNSPGDTLQANIDDNENTPGEHGVEIIGTSGSGSSNIILSGLLVDSPAGSGIIGRNLTGTNRLNNNSLVTNIDNPATHGLFLRNASGFNLTLFEVNDTDFTNSSSGASTLNVKNDGTANMTVEVRNGCIFEALDSQAVTMDGGGTAATTGTLTSLVTGCTFRNAVVSEPSPGVFVTSENNVAALVVNGATHNATISNNTFENIAEDGRVANTSIIRTQNSGGKLTAVVSNNLIQNIAYQTGAGGRHVIGHVFEPTAHNAANFSNLRFEGNTATNITFTATNREFIFVDYRNNASGGDIKILSNNWNMPTSAATSEAMELNFEQVNASTVDLQVDNNGQGTGAISNTSTRFLRIDSEDAATVNATVTNNRFTNNNATPGLTIDFNTLGTAPTMCVNVSGNTLLPSPAANTIRFNEAAGTMTVTQASSAAVTAANNGAVVTVAGSPLFGQPACALPSNAPATMSASSTGTDSGATTQTTTLSGSTSTASRMGGGVTSRPFVSMPRQTTTTTTQAPTTTTQTSRTTSGDTIQASPPVVNSGTLTFTIGSLPAGESVTIKFSVTINEPFPALNPSEVKNQGTVTCTECPVAGIKTDDPDVVGADQFTITPVIAPPDIFVKDASGPEPATGSSTMAFTVVLSTPAPAGGVDVSFQTADEPAGPGKAVAGSDYTPTNGTLEFAEGQTVQTISVPILSDTDSSEPNETFLVNLSAPVGGIIADGQAVGTITAANPAGAILISELRTFGPPGATQAGDDFVEIYNNSNTQHVVDSADNTGYGLFRMGATCNDTPVLIGTISEGTPILGRGHFLFVGSQYSLGAAAAGNQTLTSDIPDNANVGLFSTTNVANLSTATRLDAVGFSTNLQSNNCDLLREGGALPAVDSTAVGLGNHSYYRSYCSFVEGVGCTTPNPGFPVDRNDNATDFLFVDTAATTAAGPSRQRLGAPGPENMTSARVTDNVGTFLVDANKSSALNPNRVRRQCGQGAAECDSTRSQFGTMAIRRRFTNNTGGTITQLRFRVVELTTIPRANGAMADMRPITSVDVTTTGLFVTDPATCAATGTPVTAPCDVTIKGTTVQAPTQAIGGGYNTTMIVTLPAGGLLNTQSVNVQFMLGVQQIGDYRFLINIEALP